MTPTDKSLRQSPLMRLTRRPALLAALVVGVVIGAPFLFGLRFIGLDHTRNLLPTLCAHDGIAKEGALLDDALGGGAPLLEEPLGLVFSPAARALAFLSAEDRASAFTWLWLVLGAASMTYLARSFGLSRRARTAAAIAWPLCGTALDLVLHGPYVVDVALVPLVWGGLRNLRRRSQARARDACAVALGLGLTALHGGFQACLWLGLLGVVEAAFALGRRPRVGPRPFERALVVGAALASGTLLACLQALPTLGLGGAAARAGGVESTAVWSLGAPEAFGVLWPLVATARSATGASLVTAWEGSIGARPEWNVSPFLGLVAVAAVVVVLRARRARPLVALAAVSGLMAVGTATPFYGAMLTLIPPLQLFRYPARIFVLTSLAVVVLAALALDAASRSVRARKALAIALGALCGLSVLVCAALMVQRDVIDAAELRVAMRAPFAGEPSLMGLVLSAVGRTTLLSIAVAALFWRASTVPRAPMAVLALPLSLALGVPVIASYGSPLFAAARQPPLARPALSLPARNAPDAPPLQVCIGRSVKALHVDLADRPLAAEGDVLVDIADHKPDLSRCGGPATPHIGLPSSQRATLALSRAIDEERGVLMPARALGCTHLVSRGTVTDVGLVRVPIDAPPFTAPFFAITDALPDASVVRAPRVVASDDHAIVEAVLDAADGAALMQIVDDPSGALTARPAPLPDGARAGAVHASFLRPDSGTVRVEGEGAAVVMVRRPWWPGFVAEQAGNPVPVVRIAGAQLGLVVDDVSAGPVSIAYRARNLGGGVGAALAGALLLFALCVALTRLRRSGARLGRSADGTERGAA
jgi:hypothetical protein